MVSFSMSKPATVAPRKLTRSYAMANPDFLHQSTMNQWFSESQFESYRLLGFETRTLLKQMLANEQFGRDATLDNLAVALQTMKRARAR